MGTLEFFKNNFQLILATVGVIFYSIMLKRIAKQGETIDKLRTEKALNEAKLNVADLMNKKKDNAKTIKDLKEERINIQERLKKLTKEDTSINLDGDDLANFLTEELNR